MEPFYHQLSSVIIYRKFVSFQHPGMVQYFSQVLQEPFMTWLKIMSWLSSLMHLSKKKVGVDVTVCCASTI